MNFAASGSDLVSGGAYSIGLVLLVAVVVALLKGTSPGKAVGRAAGARLKTRATVREAARRATAKVKADAAAKRAGERTAARLARRAAGEPAPWLARLREFSGKADAGYWSLNEKVQPATLNGIRRLATRISSRHPDRDTGLRRLAIGIATRRPNSKLAGALGLLADRYDRFIGRDPDTPPPDPPGAGGSGAAGAPGPPTSATPPAPAAPAAPPSNVTPLFPTAGGTMQITDQVQHIAKLIEDLRRAPLQGITDAGVVGFHDSMSKLEYTFAETLLKLGERMMDPKEVGLDHRVVGHWGDAAENMTKAAGDMNAGRKTYEKLYEMQRRAALQNVAPITVGGDAQAAADYWAHVG